MVAYTEYAVEVNNDKGFVRQIDVFSTCEEAEEELGIKITDEQWENEDYISEGGYENWNFEI